MYIATLQTSLNYLPPLHYDQLLNILVRSSLFSSWVHSKSTLIRSWSFGSLQGCSRLKKIGGAHINRALFLCWELGGLLTTLPLSGLKIGGTGPSRPVRRLLSWFIWKFLTFMEENLHFIVIFLNIFGVHLINVVFECSLCLSTNSSNLCPICSSLLNQCERKGSNLVQSTEICPSAMWPLKVRWHTFLYLLVSGALSFRNLIFDVWVLYQMCNNF